MKHYSIGSAIGRRCMFVERYFRLFCRLWIVVFGAVSFARCTQICSGCCVLLRDRTTPLETTRLLNYEAIDVIAASMFDGTMKKNNALVHHQKPTQKSSGCDLGRVWAGRYVSAWQNRYVADSTKEQNETRVCEM